MGLKGAGFWMEFGAGGDRCSCSFLSVKLLWVKTGQVLTQVWYLFRHWAAGENQYDQKAPQQVTHLSSACRSVCRCFSAWRCVWFLHPDLPLRPAPVPLCSSWRRRQARWEMLLSSPADKQEMRHYLSKMNKIKRSCRVWQLKFGPNQDQRKPVNLKAVHHSDGFKFPDQTRWWRRFKCYGLNTERTEAACRVFPTSGHFS